MSVQSRLVWCLERICTLMFVVMTSLLFIQAVLRYAFSGSLFWAEEVARYVMVWIVFLGAVMASCKHAHTRIGFFVDLLPRVPRRIVEGTVILICAAACGLIAWYGITVFKVAMLGRSPALGLRLGYVYAAVPLSCFVMALLMLVQGVRQLAGKPETPVLDDNELDLVGDTPVQSQAIQSKEEKA